MKTFKFNKSFIILFLCLLTATSCNQSNEIKQESPVIQLNHMKALANQLEQEISNIEEDRNNYTLEESCKLITDICSTWKKLITSKLVNIPEVYNSQNLSLVDLKLKLEEYYQGTDKKEIINLTSTLTVCHSILMDDENRPRNIKLLGIRETKSLRTFLNIDIQPICNTLITDWDIINK